MAAQDNVVYDVRVLGKSIGLTFNKREAESWAARTTSPHHEIVTRRYYVPQYKEIMARLAG